jgi:pimeloyl-ACP methyl ester carboxylesterase
VQVSGIQLFYREAGSPEALPVVLLHGFPSSSFQFRYLLPALAQHYYALAPDFPGFGFSACPERDHYSYNFHRYTDTIETFLQTLRIDRFALYVHDYGAQVGFQLALRHPERIGALVVQNSEAYFAEGRSPSWTAMEEYWRDGSPEKRLTLKDRLFTEEGIRSEFLEHLSPDVRERFDPAVIALAWAQINRPGVIDALLDLHLDYRSNVGLYPAFQKYFRTYQPPALIIWGRDDQYYSEAAALAYKRDLPRAEVRIIGGGHWALETHGPQVTEVTMGFLARTWSTQTRV